MTHIRRGEKVFVMKRLLLILILTFSFQTLAKADDIRDFQIEGMSIGDSLLDFYSKNKAKSFIQKKQYPKSQRIKIYMLKDEKFTTYDYVSADIIEDGTYRILKISGKIRFKNNIDDCYNKMNEIDNDLKEIFTEKNRYSGDKKHRGDKSGKSTMKVIGYSLKDDDINIQCTDWSDEMKFTDVLTLMLMSKEWQNFIDNEAYK